MNGSECNVQVITLSLNTFLILLGCASNCATCTGDGDTDCITCADGWFLTDKDYTVITTPAGSPPNPYTPLCELCSSNCAKCSIVYNNCISCKTGWALWVVDDGKKIDNAAKTLGTDTPAVTPDYCVPSDGVSHWSAAYNTDLEKFGVLEAAKVSVNGSNKFTL